MARKPVARIGDTGSHGGAIATASSLISADNRRLALVGDMYDCPIHGKNPIVTGILGNFGEKKCIAHVESQTACGAVITTGSSKVFVDVPDGYVTSQAESLLAIEYVNKCKICNKDVDGPPLQDKSYNMYFEGKEDAVCCDGDWERKLRKLIDGGEHDIDNLWSRLCQWHVEHKQTWHPKNLLME